MSQKLTSFMRATGLLSILAALFMLVQCEEKRDALYGRAAYACVSGGGNWIDIADQCVPRRQP